MTKAGSCLIAWIALAATACGSGASSTQTATSGGDPAVAAAPTATPAEPPAASAACQQAVDSMFAVTAASEPPELRARSAKVFVNRCQKDGWSEGITGCMAAVKVPEDADRCEAMLTPEQRRELADELAVELDAAGVRPEFQSGKPRPGKPAPRPAGGAAPALPPPPAAEPAKSSAPPNASKKSKSMAPAEAPPADRAPASKAAPGRASDPDEGGE